MNITWDANKYTSDFSFVHQYGNDLITLIDAEPGSTVLDLGCGNGALTRTLRENGFRVTGLDASGELLRLAERNYPDIAFIQADATNFAVKDPFDVIFSNAVLHWIDKDRQPDMLNCVYKALKEGGQFVFEFGGYGNNRLIHGALEKTFAEHHYVYHMPFYFPTIGEYSALVENEGFQVVYAVLFDRPTELKGENGLKDWIDMFVKTPFSVIENTEERESIKNAAVDRLKDFLYKDGKWYADYVRLRMKIVKLRG